MSSRNPLHEYVNWTYNLSLYAMSIGEYNSNVYANPTVDLGGTLLVASGGKQAGRNKHFKEDFYFEKMTMMSSVAPSTRSRNSNTMAMSFTLIEPMGVSLFNRLIAVATDLGVQKVSEMPYYVKIEWKGWNIDGTPANIPIVKVVPVRLATIVMKVNARGAQYDIETTPYNHQVFDEAVGTLPIRVEGSGCKVGEMVLHDQRAKPPVPTQGNMVLGVAPTDEHVRSITSAINNWYANQASEKHAKNVDSVVFELTHPMHGGMLVPTEHMTPQGGYMPTPGTPAADQSSITTSTRPKAHLNSNLSFAQGTAIGEMLSAIIRESDWVGNQAGDEQQGGGSGGTGQTKWFRIISRVEVGPWEPAFNRYVKKYVYRAVPYMVNNTKNRAFPLINTMPSVAKDYQYIFTGKNDDVLDLELKFDCLWYSNLTTNQENRYSVSGGQECTPTLDPRAHGGAAGQLDAYAAAISGGKGHFSHDTFPTAYTATSIKLNDGSKNEKAREMQEQLMNKSGGDMCSIKLKIVGDPDWLKQDDILFWHAPGDKTPNGSITMDNNEVHISVTAKTASDYNGDGLAIPGTGDYTMGAFSGIYRVIQVDSTFDGGKFTQVLDCTRIPNQPTPN